LNKPCVLVPVYNAAARLEARLVEVLELLGAAAGRFELYVVDDGSTDDTAETAWDLAYCYPQIRVIRHPERLGLAGIIQRGLNATPAEIVLVDGESYAMDPNDLGTLWQLRDAQRRSPPPLASCGATWIARLCDEQSLAAGRSSPSRYQIIGRAACEQFRVDQAEAGTMRIDRQARPTPSETRRPAFLGTNRPATPRA
jgi:glycosyltransferase involved in cell wall biosynthesis